MHTFFHGWRRKAGCVTLVMVLAICGLWVRSRSYLDVLGIPGMHRQHVIESSGEVLCWSAFENNKSTWGFESEKHWHHTGQYLSLELGRNYEEVEELRFREWRLPYWIAVLSGALLSAYLILWKPRKAKLSDQPAISNLISN